MFCECIPATETGEKKWGVGGAGTANVPACL